MALTKRQKTGIGVAAAVGIAVLVKKVITAPQILRLEKSCEYCGVDLIIRYRVIPSEEFPITSYFVCPVCGETNILGPGNWELISVERLIV